MISRDDSAYTGYLLRGAAHLFGGQSATALDDLEWARQLRPGQDSGWLLTLLGLGRFYNKERETAVDLFAAALARDANLSTALFGRARCHLEAGEFLLAVDDLSRVVELDPGFADAYILRGECFDELNRYDESTHDYDRANELLGGSTLMAYKIWCAQAMKEEKEQAASLEEENRQREAPDREVTPPKPGDDLLHQWLQDYLRTDAKPGGDPHRSTTPTRALA
jgi:tetratricopeptide (TPR) repeat protein